MLQLWPAWVSYIIYVSLYVLINDNRHKKDACPEPKIFKGKCNNCGEEGHSATKCETKICYNCKEIGHTAADCTNNRVFDNKDVPEMASEAAWEKLKKADDGLQIDGDLHDVREVGHMLQVRSSRI